MEQKQETPKEQELDLGYLKYIFIPIKYFILSLLPLSIAFAIWLGWTKSVSSFEGKDLIAYIAKAQRAYFLQHNTFHSIGETPVSFDPVLNIDARNNRYYRHFSGAATDYYFTLRVYGEEGNLFSGDRYFTAKLTPDFFNERSFPVDFFSRNNSYNINVYLIRRS